MDAIANRSCLPSANTEHFNCARMERDYTYTLSSLYYFVYAVGRGLVAFVSAPATYMYSLHLYIRFIRHILPTTTSNWMIVKCQHFAVNRARIAHIVYHPFCEWNHGDNCHCRTRSPMWKMRPWAIKLIICITSIRIHICDNYIVCVCVVSPTPFAHRAQTLNL